MLRPHETADKWIDDGKRAGMDSGEARCMIVEERRGERRLAFRDARITSQVSRMTWKVSIMYHVWVGRSAGETTDETRRRCAGCVVHARPGMCTYDLLHTGRWQKNLWPTKQLRALDHVD